MIDKLAQKKSKKDRKELVNLRIKLEEECTRSADYIKRLKYLQADFENHLKRVKKDSEESIKRANEQLILKIIPIINDLEKAVEIERNVHHNKNLLEGVEMVLKKIVKVCKEEGLEEIKAIGEIFHPSKHEAISQTFLSNKPEGLIVKEFRKGYIFKDRVLRPSLVEVVGHKNKQKS